MFTVELCNDEDYCFFERHKIYDAKVVSLREAMTEAVQAQEGDWYVAQVTRPFSDCTLDQPVYDAINGCMYDESRVNDPHVTWAMLMGGPEAKSDTRPTTTVSKQTVVGSKQFAMQYCDSYLVRYRAGRAIVVYARKNDFSGFLEITDELIRTVANYASRHAWKKVLIYWSFDYQEYMVTNLGSRYIYSYARPKKFCRNKIHGRWCQDAGITLSSLLG